MFQHFAPCRSALYVPGDNPRALVKARDLPADVLILDLEDAVSLQRKVQARENVRRALSEGFPRHNVVVRINALRTPWGDDDVQMVLAGGPHGIVLPKAEDPAEVRALNLGIPLWLMIETPRGVLRLEELAAVPGVAALIAGTSDLARELRARQAPGREHLLYVLSKIVLCARAFGLRALDGVQLDLADAAGLRAVCEQGRNLGFDGKTVIHPAQIDIANVAFGPTPREVQKARDLLEAWENAGAQGKSVAVLEGKLIEHLHADQARETLAAAREIEERTAFFTKS